LAQASKPAATPQSAVSPAKATGRVNAGQLSKRDFEFVQHAADAATSAIGLGQLALQKAESKQVQGLARTIVSDHQQELQDLRQLALQKGESVSTNAPPEAIQLSQSLSRRPDFDKAYVEQVIRDHRQHQRLAREAAANGDDAEVKRFANASLKRLEQHLATARALEGSAASQKSPSSNLADADVRFLEDAVSRGLLQVRLAEQARGRSDNQAVRDFSTRLAKEHAKVNDELLALASKKGVNLSRELGLSQKESVVRLGKLQGQEYQNQFLAYIVKEHETDIANFKQQSQSGKDSELREYARKTLPMLEEHLKLARDATTSAQKASAAK
jgi:putative membrane protein